MLLGEISMSKDKGKLDLKINQKLPYLADLVQLYIQNLIELGKIKHIK